MLKARFTVMKVILNVVVVFVHESCVFVCVYSAVLELITLKCVHNSGRVSVIGRRVDPSVKVLSLTLSWIIILLSDNTFTL